MRSQLLSEMRAPPCKTEEEIQEWLSFREEEINECDRRYEISFRRLLRYSSLVVIYTLMESNLSLIAKQISERKKLALDLDDLKAKDQVKQFKKFWTCVAGLNWWEDPGWQVLRDIEQLRHCIVHRNGVLRENDAQIRQLAKKRDSGVRVVKSNDLKDTDSVDKAEVDEGYCLRAIEQMSGLLKQIFDRAGCFGPDHVVVGA